jgi:hypothetical protein
MRAQRCSNGTSRYAFLRPRFTCNTNGQVH